MNTKSTGYMIPLLFFVFALTTVVVIAQTTGDAMFLPVIRKEGTPPTPTNTTTLTPTPTATDTPTAIHTATLTVTSTPTPAPPPALHFPLAYGPYRTGQAPGGATPPPAQLLEDLDILNQETHLIRLYGSCNDLARIPPLAAQRMIQLYQGAWLTNNSAANQQELNCYQQLLRDNSNIQAGVIGNEVLLRGELIESQLADYLTQAEQWGAVDLSTADTWAHWCALRGQKPRCPGLSLLRTKADFILIHVHPYWDGAPIDQAAAHVIAVQIFVRATFPDKPVVIGETGWPTCGAPEGSAQPSVANQRRFIEELWHWTKLYNIQIVYFEAFDEPWKNEPNGVGPCWGMYNVDRTPKHTNLDWSTPMPVTTPPTTTLQIDYPSSNITTTTKGNCSIPIFGRVYQAQAGWQVQVEVFTNQWYLQDGWYTAGRAPVVDGQWSVPEVTLGGQEQFNQHKIRATLVDAQGNAMSSAEVSGIVRANACLP